MNTVTGKGSVVQIILPNLAGRGIGKLLAEGLESIGMLGYTVDMKEDSVKQIECTLINNPNVWFGDARTIYRITKEMEGKIDLSKLGVNVLFLTMDYIPQTMIRNLERIWQCRVATHYGLTEMGWGLAVDCSSGAGYHYNELDVIIEVVDPISGRKLPDGTKGELVFTSLGREAMPVIRYRSRDIAALQGAPCVCGRNLKILSHVIRRQDTIISIDEGIHIYPALFDDIVYGFDMVVDYNIYIDKQIYPPQLHFKIETLWQSSGIMKQIKEAVQALPVIQKHMGAPKIELLPLGALKENCAAKKLIRVLD